MSTNGTPGAPTISAQNNLMPRRRARRLAAACAACATAAAAWIVRSSRQAVHASLETAPAVSLEAHWLLGAVPTTQQFYAARKGGAEDPWANPVVHALSVSLELRSTRLTRPLRVVSRDPLGMRICLYGADGWLPSYTGAPLSDVRVSYAASLPGFPSQRFSAR